MLILRVEVRSYSAFDSYQCYILAGSAIGADVLISIVDDLFFRFLQPTRRVSFSRNTHGLNGEHMSPRLAFWWRRYLPCRGIAESRQCDTVEQSSTIWPGAPTPTAVCNHLPRGMIWWTKAKQAQDPSGCIVLPILWTGPITTNLLLQCSIPALVIKTSHSSWKDIMIIMNKCDN